MEINPALISLAKQKAEKYKLDADLVCAVIEQESAWNTLSMRFEKGFLAKYVAPLYTAGKITATEAYARSFSWGLLQIMGQVAREEGFTGPYLSELCDPEKGLDAGCNHLAIITARITKKMQQDGDTSDPQEAILLAWNGGANEQYPQEVANRIPHYNA